MPRPSIKFPEPLDLGPRDWGQETLLFETPHYIGKALYMKAGSAGGLQYHRRKIETFLIADGRAAVDYDDGGGTLISRILEKGDVVHVPVGAPHRVRAFTDCLIFEWSTPIFNDRVRVEHEYGEEISGGLPTTS